MKKKPDTSLSLSEQVRDMVEAMELTSIEEIDALAQQMGRQHNQRKLDQFDGLSPEQMSDFMYQPFHSPDLIAYAADIDIPEQAPALMLATMLMEGVGDKGIKLTPKGNLPMKFCRSAQQRFYEVPSNKREYIPNVRTERDFEPMHSIKCVVLAYGLVRKYKGRLVLTKKGKALQIPEQRAALFLLLFQEYSLLFNWAYRDAAPEAPVIQNSFLYTLFLLHRYGETRRLDKFYVDKFTTAFPTVIEEMKENIYTTKEDQIHFCYTLRTMERFAKFFGLIKMEYEDDEEHEYKKKCFITKTPLLDQFIRFNV